MRPPKERMRISQIWNVGSFELVVRKSIALVCICLLCMSCASSIPTLSFNPWNEVSLPTDSTLSDLVFNDENHGWIVGSNATLLETTDGGDVWIQRDLSLDDDRYRLTSISFEGNEGWIVGQPSLLLHTSDEGQTWSEIPLSSKLPGSPILITALGPDSAEMVTDLAAIYRTADGGQTWKGQVLYGSDLILNIARSPEDNYLAVSERGSFFLTFKPGQDTWDPHIRTSSRRIQNMGFGFDDRLWLLLRGGGVQFSEPNSIDEWDDPISPERRNQWGLLDLAYRTPKEIWVTGGGGSLYVSADGGSTWFKDQEVDDIPSNFYRIIFTAPDQGFILGQRGILLKYEGNNQPIDETAAV